MNFSNQTKNETWVDHKGQSIPKGRVFKEEQRAERLLAQIMKKAISLQGQLQSFRESLEKTILTLMKDQVPYKDIEELIERSFTAYNFDRSVKIEKKVNKSFNFNEEKLDNAYKKLLEYIDSENPPEQVAILIKDAFKTTRGALDKNKITKLLSYKSENVNPKFGAALYELEGAKEPGDMKAYYQLYVGENQVYESINLTINQ